MRLAALSVAALVLSGSAAAGLPTPGALLAGRSLGGVHLGEQASAVRAALGPSYGVCKGCATTTWYFTYHRFDRRGLAVELTGGRVSALYTLWRPAGWTASRGLKLGAVEAQITALAGATIPIVCSGYDARIVDDAHARTVYYVFRGKLWGFGLLQPRADPCR
jgi:hypothetical protein